LLQDTVQCNKLQYSTIGPIDISVLALLWLNRHEDAINFSFKFVAECCSSQTLCVSKLHVTSWKLQSCVVHGTRRVSSTIKSQ